MIDDRLREQLGALLDGALDDAAAAELRARIAEDAGLKKEFEELRRTVQAVRGLPRESAPIDLRARVNRAIDAPPVQSTNLGPARWIAVAAVLLCAVGLAFVLSGGTDTAAPVSVESRAADADKGAWEEGGALKDDDSDDESRVLETAIPSEPTLGAAKSASRERRFEKKPQPAELDMVEEEAGLDRLDRADEARPRQKLGGKAEGGDGEELKKSAAGLLAAVQASGRLAPEDRAAYLFQLRQLDEKEVKAHVLGLGAFRTAPVFAAGSTVVSGVAQATEGFTSVSLQNRNEATIVNGLLSSFVAVDAGRAGLTVRRAKARPEVSTVIEGTPAELRHIGAWLYLLDTSPIESRREAAARKPTVLVTRKKKGKRGDREEAEAAREKLRVVLRYGRPEPKAKKAETAEAESNDKK